MFQRASVVVLPYIEATQSGVIPLAYSFAKPVVATRVGALADSVDDDRTGRLVPPADSGALASAVIALLKNADKRRTMGAAGREKLEQEWSPDAVAGHAIDVYRRAIRDRQRTSVATDPAERVVMEAVEGR
ncbi:MAG: glycosyltransferase family 4 protein [Pirellulales bacterium]|nr:glycosyltransferase family 4 protein [Pirellulales bacterium]